MPKVKSLTISHTSLAAWRKSPRRAYYEYVLGLSPKDTTGDPIALNFGSVIHKFCELYVPGSSLEEIILLALAEAPLAPSGPNRTAAHAEQLMRTYASTFPPQAGSVELELSFPLTDRVTYVGHLDVLTADQIIDYKTTSKHLYWDWARTIAPNPQAIGYIVAARENGHHIDSLLFRGISTDHKLLDPSYVPKKRDGSIGERAPLFLDQIFLPEQFAIDEWKASVLRDVSRLIEDLESGTYTCHCNIGDWCNWREVCLTSPENRANVISNAYDSKPFRGFKLEWESQTK